jgi:hypothetical protein
MRRKFTIAIMKPAETMVTGHPASVQAWVKVHATSLYGRDASHTA